MKRIDLRGIETEPIDGYDSALAFRNALADGEGEAHFYFIRIEAGGGIGRHEAGFGQLFLVLEGSGWAAGGDGKRVPISAGQGVWIARGEHHEKGSEMGLSALIVQVRDLTPRAG
ncbi:MAG TPA: cupin domain-containing protein [Myxococcota bacterium]|nr:cupin domain-containing protein [Myxococcota bacterium]